MSTAEDEIKQFLNDNPDGLLRVGTEVLSLTGLAWLSENIKKRPITILTGPLPKSIQGLNVKEEKNIHKAINFLKRDNIKLYSWKDDGSFESVALLQCFLATSAALVDSPKLVLPAIRGDVEKMVLANPAKTQQISDRFEQMLKEADLQTSWVIEYMGLISDGAENRF